MTDIEREVRKVNPFAITKAVDLDDHEILNFWTDTPNIGDVSALHPRLQPAGIPVLLLGAKGSGKTHLMRYRSFEVQSLRFTQSNSDIRQGIVSDKYVGMYLKCSGLNAGRFSGKLQSSEVWREVFAYYIELWLTQNVLQVSDALNLHENREQEFRVCSAIVDLLDRKPEVDQYTVNGLMAFIRNERNHLDYQINNCVFTGKLDIEILSTRGKLIFGIPKVLVDCCEFLKGVVFLYCIDELETLSLAQQRLINSLIRERQVPTTFYIGSRLYGIKTFATEGTGEENVSGSEFNPVVLDEHFRRSKRAYASFCRDLVKRRLVAPKSPSIKSSEYRSDTYFYKRMFRTIDQSWSSSHHIHVVRDAPSIERRHFRKFRQILGATDAAHAERTVSLLAVNRFPVLEKVNLLIFYRSCESDSDWVEVAEGIRDQCEQFISDPKKKSHYASVLKHYQSDVVAQLRRENSQRQLYLGLDNFIHMSAGLPRVLLTTLRSVIDWSIYNGEDPLRTGIVSIQSQYRGVLDSSDWFFNNMRKSGRDGISIQRSVERLAELLRTNRFSDNPVECSACAFSVSERKLTDRARTVLELAENRSFILCISRGQKDRNSPEVQMKFQIHPMLAPRWDLPIARRGALVFTPEIAQWVFWRR